MSDTQYLEVESKLEDGEPVAPWPNWLYIVRIASVLPKPALGREEIILENTGQGTLYLSGWTLENLANHTIDLSGSIPEGNQTVIVPPPDSLDDGGDTVRLIDQNGYVVDTVTYTCNRSTDDPNLFAFFERYTTRQAHEEHSRSDKFLELVSALQGSVDGPVEIETYEELAAKL